MNEKIYHFFACIGVFFTTLFAVVCTIFARKSRRNCNNDKSGMGQVEAKLADITDTQRTEAEILGDCQSIIDSVEKRNSRKNN